MTPPLRALIYTRVSSDNAGGRSVDEQEAECRAVCERNGWPVFEVFTDNDRSASRYATKDRPEYARLKTTLTPVRRQLEEVETEMAEGRMPAATGARVATRLEAQITAAEVAAAPTFINPSVKALAEAPDPVAMWRDWEVVTQREFIRAVLVIEIEPIGRGRWADKRKGISIRPRRRAV